MQEQNAENLPEKRKRLVVALTIAGTMLLLFLVILLGVQFGMYAAARAEEKRLDQEIEKYNKILEEDNKDLEYYSSKFYKYERALEMGWKPSQK